MKTPSIQYSFGDPAGNLGATIDRWDDNLPAQKYQAQTWADGQPTNLAYFPTFEEAIGWIKQQFVEDFVKLHDQYAPEQVNVIGLAPGRSIHTDPWTWSPVDESYASDWWLGSDYEDAASRPIQIHFFPQHEA